VVAAGGEAAGVVQPAVAVAHLEARTHASVAGSGSRDPTAQEVCHRAPDHVPHLGHDRVSEGAEALCSLSALVGDARRLFVGLLLSGSDGPPVRVQSAGKPIRASTQAGFRRPWH
jgi:hypothetical protein